jgi:hypothetical protein
MKMLTLLALLLTLDVSQNPSGLQIVHPGHPHPAILPPIESTLLPLLAHSMHRPTTGPQGAGSPCGQFDSIGLIKLGRPMFCGLP